MSPRMNARDRRAMLIGLAILVPSLGWIYGVRPMRAALADTNDRVVAEQDAFAREQAAVREAARNPARKRLADSALAGARPRVFEGANEVAAGASLVTYLGEVARRTHVWLSNASTRAAPVTRRGTASAPASPDGLTPLRVELRAESDFQGILEFLDALERGSKVVIVERLDVARTLRAGEEDQETLAVTATVVGYAFSDAQRASGPAPATAVAPGAPSARVAP